MGFSLTTLADSISPAGHRITTFEISYPRIIHAEMLRHGVLRRCAASSRAIPVSRFIEQVTNDPYIPTHWGANQKGMVADKEVDAKTASEARTKWLLARDRAVEAAQSLLDLGIHKQVTNRLLEPFQWMTEIVTGTEWENFEHLRVHPDAAPDIQNIARLMQEARRESKPVELSYGEWHLPRVNGEFERTDPKARDLSAGRAAMASYLKFPHQSTVEDDLDRSSRMLTSGHMSPFEHPCRPMTAKELKLFRQWETIGQESDGTLKILRTRERPIVAEGDLVNQRVTYFLGSYNGWVSYRKEIPFEFDPLAHR